MGPGAGGEQAGAGRDLAEAYTPFRLNNGQPTNYGYGWGIRNVESGKIVSHGGSLVGYRTFLLRHLAAKQTIVMLTNKGTVPINNIVTEITRILNDKPHRMPRIPIATKIQQIIEEAGVPVAITRYGQLTQNAADRFIFNDNELNAVGYYLLRDGRVQDAIAILELNVLEYPQAANPYDSLGEACMIGGQLELAAKNYRKSLALYPDNENGRAMLRKIETMQKAESH